ncbi:hypothetical protein CCYA_CCYA01G0129 [Cyanidiococcus yangmingshanensis]|nr:hypothetical protein CCYA_CCYA01G0129 [Cyanidiococcus yangmingshanensis]
MLQHIVQSSNGTRTQFLGFLGVPGRPPKARRVTRSHGTRPDGLRLCHFPRGGGRHGFSLTSLQSKLSPREVERCKVITRNWIRDFVIELQLCPYARAPFASGQVRIAVSDAAAVKAVERALVQEAALLIQAEPTELATTLLVLPQFYQNDFIRFYASSLALERRWEARDQGRSLVLVFFHPHHVYAKQNAALQRLVPVDSLDYERRAPLPTINLLRGDQVDEVVATGKSAEMLEQNAVRLSQVSLEALEMRFQRLLELNL